MKQILIRSQIVAPKNHLLIELDLAQAESWVVAYLANEPNMKHSLHFGEFHLDTAVILFDKTVEELLLLKKENPLDFSRMRYIAKQQNHAKAYREGYRRAAEIINRQSDRPPFVTVTVSESKVYHDKWHGHYMILGWWGEIEEQLRRNRTIVTPYGRIRRFYDSWGEELFRKATAHNPQSTVADHFNGKVQSINPVSGGLIEIKRQLSDKQFCRIINQSHDSCLLEAPSQDAQELAEQAANLLRRPIIINGESFTIPVEGKIGERWGELEKAEV
jgi:DNA polymerase I-like protein with 3'-5' exonuclease and polymerase domains